MELISSDIPAQCLLCGRYVASDSLEECIAVVRENIAGQIVGRDDAEYPHQAFGIDCISA